MEERLRRCKLEAHPDKTRLVYGRDSNRRRDQEHIQFDFLGYGFRPRQAKGRTGKIFTSFLPAISRKAVQAIGTQVRGWGIQRRSAVEWAALARSYNPEIRGWVNYYGRYYRTALHGVFRQWNRRLVRWAQRKYKRFRVHEGRAWFWLRRIACVQPDLFAHWHAGFAP